jgi:uncharacterized Zn finger protein
MFEIHNSSSLTLIQAPFQKREVQIGTVIHASTDLQFVVGRVTKIENQQVTIEWDSQLIMREKSDRRLILSQLDSIPMRILGHGVQIKKE